MSNYDVRSLQEICEEIDDGSYCGHFSRQVWADILVALKEISTTPEQENLTLTRYCDPQTQQTSGYISLVLDEDTGSLTTVYLDVNLQITETPPTGEPCGDHDFDYKWSEACYRQLDDHSIIHTRMTCIPLHDGVPQPAVTFWVLSDGTVTDTAPANIQPCESADSIMINRTFC